MNEDPLKIDELTARLRVDPGFVKDLLSEMAHQLTKEYLTIEELAKRLSWEERTVRNKMKVGIFQRGVHYFSPKGIRPRFKWSAVVAWLEGKDAPASSIPADAIPMARGYYLGSGLPTERRRHGRGKGHGRKR